ncbi:MAG: sigma-70 family RNA polymerase sigma factor, partial [Acidobacteria bacterium]|nr:sigma-70 family RNA polymerase sigma factor [Acidobacteriota bacterium]
MSESFLPDEAFAPPTEEAANANLLQWTDLVERIRKGNDNGLEELYRIFSRGIRFYICRQLGPQELDDRVHDTFLIVVQAIQRGELREPERLMGFVRTIVRRQVAAQIDQTIHQRRDSVELDNGLRIADDGKDPEQAAMIRERTELARQVLATISPRDREILTRFYLFEQSQEQICGEMNLSETQFRLLKSRAKARFGELGRKKMARSGLTPFFLRAPAA